MTVIAGFNLTTKVILAADSRLSFEDAKPYEDTALKIFPLQNTGEQVWAAGAGPVSNVVAIGDCLETGTTAVDDKFLENCRIKIDGLIKSNLVPSPKNTCLILAGTSNSFPHSISGERLISTVSAMQDHSTVNGSQELIEAISDPEQNHEPRRILKRRHGHILGAFTIINGVVTVREIDTLDYVVFGTDGISTAEVPTHTLGLIEDGLSRFAQNAPIDGQLIAIENIVVGLPKAHKAEDRAGGPFVVLNLNENGPFFVPYKNSDYSLSPDMVVEYADGKVVRLRTPHELLASTQEPSTNQSSLII